MKAPFDLQPHLADLLVTATPLQENDFDALFAAASDPLIWQQHPNPLRYQYGAFRIYFEGAMQSGGAFLVRDSANGQVIGSSRYSDYIPETNTISIGYTFFIRRCWGKGYNYALKKLMLDHIFQYADAVTFFIGAVNKRSQVSIERLGARRIGEKNLAYFGEAPKLDYVYEITRAEWQQTLRHLLV